MTALNVVRHSYNGLRFSLFGKNSCRFEARCKITLNIEQLFLHSKIALYSYFLSFDTYQQHKKLATRHRQQREQRTIISCLFPDHWRATAIRTKLTQFMEVRVCYLES